MKRFIKVFVVLMVLWFAMPAVAPAWNPRSFRITCAVSCLLVSPGPGRGLGECLSGCKAESTLEAHVR
jgi:hypothetical protein